MGDPTWNFMAVASRQRVMGAVRREMAELFSIASDPARWEAPTACEAWEVRDVVGHLVDTTEGYLPAFAAVRTGTEMPAPKGVRDMARMVDEGAKAFRKVPQDELLARLRDAAARMLNEFDALTDEEWTGTTPAHPYMGPVPAMFYAIFQLVDYAVHGWDIREGLGRPHGLDGESADLLAPLIYIVLQATAEIPADTEPFSVGIRTSGPNGGDVRADVSSDGVQFAPGDVSDCAAVLELDPGTFVLTGYGRMNGGTVRGDAAAASRFRSLFFPI